jgi:uncharacterized membrane protein (Fun14 family)
MSLAPAVYLLSIGGIGGFFVGYGIRKVTKILAIALGVFFLAVISLDYIGVFAINYEGIVELISKLFDPTQAAEVLMPLIANLPLVGSFTAGFAIGLKRG